MENIRFYLMPEGRMVSSQCGMFGDVKLEKFNEWFSEFERPLYPKDFLWYDDEREGFVWYYMFSEGMNIPEDFQLVDFEGGLYAVATEIDGEDSTELMTEIRRVIADRGFEEDPTRKIMGTVTTAPQASQVLGYEQMDYFVPIKAK
jgi:AraC family transcriptional regulator